MDKLEVELYTLMLETSESYESALRMPVSRRKRMFDEIKKMKAEEAKRPSLPRKRH